MTRAYYDLPHDITTIDANYVRPGIACLHMLIARDRVAFFDTGTTLSLPRVEHQLARKGLTRDNVDYVIPTHVHLDHAGGAGAMMRAFPNARLIVHPLGARHMIDPEKLWTGTVAVYGESNARALYGEVVPVPAERVVTAADGFELDFNGRPLRFLDTPGHARHHFCVVDTTHHGIFAGDTFGISYRAMDGPNGPFLFPTTAPVQFEPEKLHASIDRLIQTDPQSLYLAHFGRITPTAVLIDSLHRHLDEFVRIGESAGEDNALMEIETGLAAYLFDQGKQHGVPLSDRELRKGVSMDAKINAQGIEVWLQRRQRSGEPGADRRQQ